MAYFDITDAMIYAVEQELLNTPGEEIIDESLAKTNAFRLIKAALKAADVQVVDCRIDAYDDSYTNI